MQNADAEAKLVVDLSLAQTYVPAFSCLARGTVLILLLLWFPTRTPILILLGVSLHIERCIRRESIFDSSAILCTILACHLLNLLRSNPQDSHELFLHPLNNHTWGTVSQIALVVTSVMILLSVDPASLVGFGKGSSQDVASSTASRTGNVIFHGILLMGVLQTPMERGSLESPLQACTRMYSFLVSCLVWTYSLGVRDMISLLTSTSRIPSLSMSWPGKGNRKTACSATVIQSFLPCHLRFTHLLLIEDYPLYLAAAICFFALSVSIYQINQVACSPDDFVIEFVIDLSTL